jgi:hypothetical protein
MSNDLVCFQGKLEIGGGAIIKALEVLHYGKAIKGPVQLHTVKFAAVMGKPSRTGKIKRIKLSFPVWIDKAGTAHIISFHTAQPRKNYSTGFEE